VVEETLARFKADLVHIFGNNLLEIMMHGSYVLGDFRPHQGDLDYTILTERDLSDTEIDALFTLHDSYRRSRDLLLYQLEGTTYPERVMANIQQPFVGCYIGTGRKGWRRIDTFQNSFIDLMIMKRHGIGLFGRNTAIYKPTEAEVHTEELKDLCSLTEALSNVVDTGSGIAFAVVHWCARTFYYLETGRIASKREACVWCGSENRLKPFWILFDQAKDKRYPYEDQGSEVLGKEKCGDLLKKAKEWIFQDVRV
jgi:hypothetical protein